MATVAMRQRGAIRIFRTQWHPAGCSRFQPEWDPVGEPDLLEGDNFPGPQRPKLPRIPRRYMSQVMSVTVSVAMSAVITLFVAIRNYGVTLESLLLWAAAWPVSCMIAVPVRFAITPLVERITSALVEPPARPE